jgi:hypothetical protein
MAGTRMMGGVAGTEGLATSLQIGAWDLIVPGVPSCTDVWHAGMHDLNILDHLTRSPIAWGHLPSRASHGA